MFKRIENILKYCGFDFKKLFRLLRLLPKYFRDKKLFEKQCDKLQKSKIVFYPLLTDAGDNAGDIGGHYFYQDLWAARKIFEISPDKHYDIGSRIDGFISHLLVFTKVCLIDIRPLKASKIKNLDFLQSDATNLDSIASNSIKSLSSLHAVEHFGLGRYGDPIDPNACYKTMQSMSRVLATNGTLYFSVPIGIEKIYFNGHRTFSPETILDQFKDLQLVSFSCVNDQDQFIEDTNPRLYGNQKFACGMFEFKKIV